MHKSICKHLIFAIINFANLKSVYADCFIHLPDPGFTVTWPDGYGGPCQQTFSTNNEACVYLWSWYIKNDSSDAFTISVKYNKDEKSSCIITHSMGKGDCETDSTITTCIPINCLNGRQHFTFPGVDPTAFCEEPFPNPKPK